MPIQKGAVAKSSTPVSTHPCFCRSCKSARRSQSGNRALRVEASAAPRRSAAAVPLSPLALRPATSVPRQSNAALSCKATFGLWLSPNNRSFEPFSRPPRRHQKRPSTSQGQSLRPTDPATETHSPISRFGSSYRLPCCRTLVVFPVAAPRPYIDPLRPYTAPP